MSGHQVEVAPIRGYLQGLGYTVECSCGWSTECNYNGTAYRLADNHEQTGE